MPLPYMMAGLAGWMTFASDLTRMNIAAGEVILRRTMQMTQGQMTPSEWIGMVAEKNTALSISAERTLVAAASGATAAAIASAALGPYGTKARANVRRLRR